MYSSKKGSNSSIYLMSFPSPGDLPDPGIEPRSPELKADSLPSEPPEKSTYLIELLTLTDELIQLLGIIFT